MIWARTTSVEETKELAAALAELARPGDLVLLAGDLGAGKTAFTQGFGAALGIDDLITSPTFTLVNTYEGRLELNHLDVYRLEALAEVLDLGVPEMIDDGGVTIIEWETRWHRLYPVNIWKFVSILMKLQFRWTTMVKVMMCALSNLYPRALVGALVVELSPLP